MITLDLSTVTSSLSGPKRPHDRVPVSQMKQDFAECLVNKVMEFVRILCDKHLPSDEQIKHQSEHCLSHNFSSIFSLMMIKIVEIKVQLL